MANKTVTKNLSVGEWVGLSFGLGILACIPFIGFLAVLGIQLYWAFGERFENHVLRNYSRASLIMMVIALILISIFFTTFAALIANFY